MSETFERKVASCDRAFHVILERVKSWRNKYIITHNHPQKYLPRLLILDHNQNVHDMKSSLNADNISYDDIQNIVHRYESHVPPKISALEKLRVEEVPEILELRKREGEAFLEKTEVTALVEWKLYVIPCL